MLRTAIHAVSDIFRLLAVNGMAEKDRKMHQKRGIFMPTTYAHYKFGKEVISALPRPLQSSIERITGSCLTSVFTGLTFFFIIKHLLKIRSTLRAMSCTTRWLTSFLTMR